MEEVVPEAVNPRGDEEVIEERQNPEAAKQEGEDRANGSGFIKNLISNVVTAGSDADAEKETISAGAGGKNEEKGGGLLDQFISNLVIPLSPKTGNISTQGKVEAFDATSENESGLRSEEEGDGGGGGGFINNFMSNLFHHSEGEVGKSKEENKKKQEVEVSEDQKKAEKTDDGGGGIIDNIVSQLPTSFPDGAAPTSDEATILIHIVQD